MATLKLKQLCVTSVPISDLDIAKPEKGGWGVTLNGLDEDGQVWWYDANNACWFPLSMERRGVAP